MKLATITVLTLLALTDVACNASEPPSQYVSQDQLQEVLKQPIPDHIFDKHIPAEFQGMATRMATKIRDDLITGKAKLEVNHRAKQRDQSFVVYGRSHLDDIATGSELTVYGSDKDWGMRARNVWHTLRRQELERASQMFDGVLEKTDDRVFKTQVAAPHNHSGPTLVSVTVGDGHTLGGDEYVTVSFNDGARLWYKAPDKGLRGYGRDRPDVWIRGRLGVNSWTPFGGQKFVSPKYVYPEQLLLTRDRTEFDPDFDVDYTGRAKVLSAVVGVVGTVVVAVGVAYAATVAVPAAVAGGAGGAAGTAVTVVPGTVVVPEGWTVLLPIMPVGTSTVAAVAPLGLMPQIYQIILSYILNQAMSYLGLAVGCLTLIAA